MLVSRIGTFEGLAVADLYAGSGALGLEALSRGAASCLFVEADTAAVAALRANADRLGAGDRAEIRARRLEHASPPVRPCEIIFLDPPYRAVAIDALLERIGDPLWLSEEGWVTLETAGGDEDVLPAGFDCEADRRFGKARIRLLRHRS
jgi:16S rRNA (guanine966-N2)-methyltransferase